MVSSIFLCPIRESRVTHPGLIYWWLEVVVNGKFRWYKINTGKMIVFIRNGSDQISPSFPPSLISISEEPEEFQCQRRVFAIDTNSGLFEVAYRFLPDFLLQLSCFLFYLLPQSPHSCLDCYPVDGGWGWLVLQVSRNWRHLRDYILCPRSLAPSIIASHRIQPSPSISSSSNRQRHKRDS